MHAWHSKHIKDMVSEEYSRVFETVPREGRVTAKVDKLKRGLDHKKVKHPLINIRTGNHRWSKRKWTFDEKSKSLCIDLKSYEHMINSHLDISFIKTYVIGIVHGEESEVSIWALNVRKMPNTVPRGRGRHRESFNPKSAQSRNFRIN